MAKLKVYVKNNQNEIKIPVGIRLLIRRCCQAVLTTEGFNKDAEVSVSFVSNNEIKILNKNYRNKDSVTDVLSFPLMEGDSEAESKKDKIMSFISAKEDFDSTLENMSNLAGEKALPHVERMKEIRNMMKAAGIEKSFVLDPAITRGLDYYTGVVYETFLNDLPSIGSVCSGGRYDNLAGLYMKDRIPGVGSSIGLDRLIAGLELLGASNKKGSFLDCEIFCLDKTLSVHYQGIASKLREQGISVEVFADEKKIGQQYTVAEKKGIPFGIMIKAEDAENNVLTLKNLLTREQFANISVEEAGKIILEAKN